MQLNDVKNARKYADKILYALKNAIQKCFFFLQKFDKTCKQINKNNQKKKI